MPRHPDNLTGTADILLSTAESGEIRVNLGNVATEEAIDTDVPVWGIDGFLSRPNDPSDNGAATAVYFHDGHQRRVIGTRDNRFSSQAGTLRPGDRMIVTDGPTRFYMKQAAQKVGVYTEAKTKPAVGGSAMTVDVDGDTGNITIKRGGETVVLTEGGVTIVCAGPASQSSIVMTPTSVTITAATINLAGTCALGFNSDQTLPGKPGVDTVLIGAMGQTGTPSPRVFAAQY